MPSDSLSHIDPEGKAAMVDVSSKPLTLREAIAEGVVFMQSETLDAIESNQMAKGNVFATARLAGIMGAKKTGNGFHFVIRFRSPTVKLTARYRPRVIGSPFVPQRVSPLPPVLRWKRSRRCRLLP